MIVLLARICKLSWFDHPELQTVITDITQLFNVSVILSLLSLSFVNCADFDRALADRPLRCGIDCA